MRMRRQGANSCGRALSSPFGVRGAGALGGAARLPAPAGAGAGGGFEPAVPELHRAASSCRGARRFADDGALHALPKECGRSGSPAGACGARAARDRSHHPLGEERSLVGGGGPANLFSHCSPGALLHQLEISQGGGRRGPSRSRRNNPRPQPRGATTSTS